MLLEGLAAQATLVEEAILTRLQPLGKAYLESVVVNVLDFKVYDGAVGGIGALETRYRVRHILGEQAATALALLVWLLHLHLHTLELVGALNVVHHYLIPVIGSLLKTLGVFLGEVEAKYGI